LLSFYEENPKQSFCLPLIVKILPIALFRKFVPAFRKPPVTKKIVPKAACDTENCSESRPCIYAGENRPIRAKESRNRNLMRLSEFILESESVFEEAGRNFNYFSLEQGKLNL
jgi:hypothetical protein